MNSVHFSPPLHSDFQINDSELQEEAYEDFFNEFIGPSNLATYADYLLLVRQPGFFQKLTRDKRPEELQKLCDKALQDLLKQETLSEMGKELLNTKIKCIYETFSSSSQDQSVNAKLYYDFMAKYSSMSVAFVLDWQRMDGTGNVIELFKSALDLTFFERDGEFFTAQKEAFEDAGMNFNTFRDLLHALPEYRDKLDECARNGEDMVRCLVDALQDKEKREVPQKVVDHDDKKSDT